MGDYKIEYSIDMIRLKKSIYQGDFKRLMKQYEVDDSLDKYYITTNYKSYKHNFNFKTDEGSFWMGYKHNAENSNRKKHNLVIEYNPNKVENSKALKDIMMKFFYNDFIVVSCDVAIDFYNVNMERDIFYDTVGKKEAMIYKSGGTKTIYIGKGANRVKIYNKAAEQGLEGDIDWTRYEVSMKVNEDVERLNNFEYKANLPNIYMIKYFRYDEDLSDTDWCILQGLVNGAFDISDLGRGKAKKIRSVLDKQTKFRPNNAKLLGVLKEYLISSSLNNIISYNSIESQKETIKDKILVKEKEYTKKQDKDTIRDILIQKDMIKDEDMTIKEYEKHKKSTKETKIYN